MSSLGDDTKNMSLSFIIITVLTLYSNYRASLISK